MLLMDLAKLYVNELWVMEWVTVHLVLWLHSSSLVPVAVGLVEPDKSVSLDWHKPFIQQIVTEY